MSSTSSPPAADTAEITNYYSSVPKKFQEEERTYATEKLVQIKIPFQMCITGATGSGKTNAVLNIIKKMNAWDKIMIWAKDTEESLYASFIDEIRTYEKKTGSSILTVSNTISDLPLVETMNKENNTLLIIDDMITEKDKALSKVSEYFIRGRKKNVSVMFLSQSYFDIPTIIRKQSGYFIFTKISGERDLSMILKDFRLGINESQLMTLYTAATKGGFPNFFMIDRHTKEPKLRYRQNFKGLDPPVATKDSSGAPIGAANAPPLFPGKTNLVPLGSAGSNRSSADPRSKIHHPDTVETHLFHPLHQMTKAEKKEVAQIVKKKKEAEKEDDGDFRMLDELSDDDERMGTGLKRRRPRSKNSKPPKSKRRVKAKPLDSQILELIQCLY